MASNDVLTDDVLTDDVLTGNTQMAVESLLIRTSKKWVDDSRPPNRTLFDMSFHLSTISIAPPPNIKRLLPRHTGSNSHHAVCSSTCQQRNPCRIFPCRMHREYTPRDHRTEDGRTIVLPGPVLRNLSTFGTHVADREDRPRSFRSPTTGAAVPRPMSTDSTKKDTEVLLGASLHQSEVARSKAQEKPTGRACPATGWRTTRDLKRLFVCSPPYNATGAMQRAQGI